MLSLRGRGIVGINKLAVYNKFERQFNEQEVERIRAICLQHNSPTKNFGGAIKDPSNHVYTSNNKTNIGLRPQIKNQELISPDYISSYYENFISAKETSKLKNLSKPCSSKQGLSIRRRNICENPSFDPLEEVLTHQKIRSEPEIFESITHAPIKTFAVRSHSTKEKPAHWEIPVPIRVKSYKSDPNLSYKVKSYKSDPNLSYKVKSHKSDQNLSDKVNSHESDLNLSNKVKSHTSDLNLSDKVLVWLKAVASTKPLFNIPYGFKLPWTQSPCIVPEPPQDVSSCQPSRQSSPPQEISPHPCASLPPVNLIVPSCPQTESPQTSSKPSVKKEIATLKSKKERKSHKPWILLDTPLNQPPCPPIPTPCPPKPPESAPNVNSSFITCPPSCSSQQPLAYSPLCPPCHPGCLPPCAPSLCASACPPPCPPCPPCPCPYPSKCPRYTPPPSKPLFCPTVPVCPKPCPWPCPPCYPPEPPCPPMPLGKPQDPYPCLAPWPLSPPSLPTAPPCPPLIPPPMPLCPPPLSPPTCPYCPNPCPSPCPSPKSPCPPPCKCSSEPPKSPPPCPPKCVPPKPPPCPKICPACPPPCTHNPQCSPSSRKPICQPKSPTSAPNKLKSKFHTLSSPYSRSKPPLPCEILSSNNSFCFSTFPTTCKPSKGPKRCPPYTPKYPRVPLQCPPQLPLPNPPPILRGPAIYPQLCCPPPYPPCPPHLPTRPPMPCPPTCPPPPYPPCCPPAYPSPYVKYTPEPPCIRLCPHIKKGGQRCWLGPPMPPPPYTLCKPKPRRPFIQRPPEVKCPDPCQPPNPLCSYGEPRPNPCPPAHPNPRLCRPKDLHCPIVRRLSLFASFTTLRSPSFPLKQLPPSTCQRPLTYKAFSSKSSSRFTKVSSTKEHKKPSGASLDVSTLNSIETSASVKVGPQPVFVKEIKDKRTHVNVVNVTPSSAQIESVYPCKPSVTESESTNTDPLQSMPSENFKKLNAEKIFNPITLFCPKSEESRCKPIPGPIEIPPNPCVPRFPHGNYTPFKSLFYFVLLPIIILFTISIMMLDVHVKPECGDYEYMRRRTKKFPWGDGMHTLFHNDLVNLMPGSCPPPLKKKKKVPCKPVEIVVECPAKKSVKKPRITPGKRGCPPKKQICPEFEKKKLRFPPETKQ